MIHVHIRVIFIKKKVNQRDIMVVYNLIHFVYPIHLDTDY